MRRARSGRALALSAALSVGLSAAWFAALTAGPSRYGHSDRVERHMLPAVSTGPMDPAWSPDGRWIAFSMRGDIWKVPAEGGEAVALTEGPAYYFEPAWSPDGRRLAFSMDVDGNLDIGTVSADGGAVTRVTTDPGVDVEPEWSGDGRALFFVSARAGGFRIFRTTPSDADAREIVAGIQPAVSPDGSTLAYVGRVRGRPGSGGLWTLSLDGSSSSLLVRYEESEYRMKPAWTPDGTALLYVSDERGSNDVVAVPAEGGSPARLTVDTLHELAPSVSPDGSRLAFVSNRAGPTTLYTSSIAGGPESSWTEVPIRGRRARVPTGRLRGRVVGSGGELLPARIQLVAGDGRAYAPDGGFHRVIAVTETHYFHAGGAFEVEVPAGPVVVEAMRGFEYLPTTDTVEVPPGGVTGVELRLDRLMDLPAAGWYSGDTHLHDLHQGRFGLSHEDFFLQLEAEDLHVSNALIHMDGTRLMGRWADLTGRPHPLSTPTHILQYGEEFRGSLGHVAMLGVGEYVLPFLGGAGGTVYAAPALDLRYFDRAEEQGGLAGFVHPYLNPVTEPARASTSLIPLDVALGRGAFYDVAALYSDEMASTEMYYRLLNAGFRLPATGGTDNFSDVWRDPPPGADRTYVRIDGPLSVASWLDGIRAGRTFASTGPLLFLDVEGRGPGDEIRLATDAGTSLRVRVELRSIAPVDSVEVVVNGRVARATAPADPERAVLETVVEIPDGGWVAARARGPSDRRVSDSYAFAHTSPVHVVRGGRTWTSPDDALFLAEAVAALRDRIEREDFPNEAERARFLRAAEEAIAVYEGIARGRE